MRFKNKNIVVAVSGGFDPIHVGHIKMLRDAKMLGDKLVVILNNDNWLKKKKTHVLMPQKEREEILKSIKWVDEVIVTHHTRNPKDISISKEILKIKPTIFAKGGKHKRGNDIPEAEACKKINCKIVFDVGPGGNFKYSSWLLAKYVNKIKPARKLNVDKVLGELGAVFKKSKI